MGVLEGEPRDLDQDVGDVDLGVPDASGNVLVAPPRGCEATGPECARSPSIAACENKLKRPLDEIDGEIIEEIQKRVLSESFVATVLREARVRLSERMKAAENDETPKLKAEAQKIRTELANLAEAVASGGAAIPALVQKMTERQGRLTFIEGRLEALHGAPRAIQLEMKRLETPPSATFVRSSRRARATHGASSRSFSTGSSRSPRSRPGKVAGTGSRARPVLEDWSGSPKPYSQRPYVDEFRTALVELAAAA